MDGGHRVRVLRDGRGQCACGGFAGLRAQVGRDPEERPEQVLEPAAAAQTSATGHDTSSAGRSTWASCASHRALVLHERPREQVAEAPWLRAEQRDEERQ